MKMQSEHNEEKLAAQVRHLKDLSEIKSEQMSNVASTVKEISDKYNQLHIASTEIMQWGGDQYEQNVKDGLLSIYSKYQ